MGNLGVFEVMATAGKASAEAEAKKGHEFERNIDRAIFRARERFGAYLANSQSKSDFDERWSEVKPQAIKVIAEVLTPTPGVIRRVGAALRPAPAVPTRTKQDRPSSAKTDEKQLREAAYAHRDEVVPGSGQVVEPKALVRVGATQKYAWAYDQTTKLYTSKDPMVKFACPGCGNEQEHLGFTHCAGCDRTWNSWPVRQASSEKTSASTYVLMAREIKMRGDQFKLAAAGNVKIAGAPWVAGAEGAALADDIQKALAADLSKIADAPMPQELPPGVSQPMPGSMPGDNSMATGAPMGPSQPAVPGGAPDQDRDLAGGVTEDSPIDQIQDALQDAIVALKDVQMLSINPQLVAMGGLKLSVVAAERRKVEKIDTLRTAMDRFWSLHKQMNYVADMLAKEANEALRTTDPRITAEAEFVRGFEAAAVNEPLPPVGKTSRPYLEGYVAFHRHADTYDTGADIGKITVPTGQDETDAGNEGSSFLNPTDSTNEIRGDAGPFDSSQPASREFASQIDADNAQGDQDRGQGSSGSIQPTSARKATTQKGGK